VKTALVIEDDEDLRRVLQYTLERAGFAVDTLEDGIHAVALPKSYSVILLDLKMPVFDGERLVDYWTLTEPELLKRVIVLSGYSHFTRGRKIPAFACVAKPYDASALLNVVLACASQS
jgi:DNA-binding response OmpR family regulator